MKKKLGCILNYTIDLVVNIHLECDKCLDKDPACGGGAVGVE